MTRATILIPAHNEAAVIGRTLLHLSNGLLRDEFKIVLIANSCSDATAMKARSILPHGIVIETATPGKCNALNLGRNEAESDRPVICLDADIDVTLEALRALIEPLEAGTKLAACGCMDVRTSDSHPLVRAYYNGWKNNPYFDRGKFGGLFAVSAMGASRVFPLPDITADDEFVRRSFAPGEVAFVKSCRFTARAPKTLLSLARVRRRSLRGAREVSSLGFRNPERGSVAVVLKRALRDPRRLYPVSVYLAVNAWARIVLDRQDTGANASWERDLTTRVEG